MPTRTVPPRECPKLAEILQALPPRELEALIGRLGLRIDAAKRLDPPQQVARVLAALPDAREPSRLPAASVELLHRIAEQRGVLVVPSLPQAVEPLIARGFVFARGGKGSFELLLPAAFMVQLRPWEGEDPRGIRALLAQTTPDAQAAIAAHYLGRAAPPPMGLALETAWDVLADPVRLAKEIEGLPPSERRVLDSVEREGGEVYTEELLELEREPLRLRTATGAAPSRRGIGFSLERRGLLVPLHPNRHVVPSEVSRIISASRHEEREARRAEVRSFVAEEDHAPRRAKFAQDAGPMAMALALAAREGQSEVRPGVGTPKSLVQRFSARFGREPNHVALLVALSRSMGLWDVTATQSNAPPGSFPTGDLSAHLYASWRRGGAWDEGRPEPETLRLAAEARDLSPAAVVREMVVEALRELGDNRWIPWASLAGYLASDARIPGLTRLFRRWAERVGVEITEPMLVAHRIVHESLPALGLLDVGDEDGEGGALALRLTPRGRALVAEKPADAETTKSKFLDSHVLRLSGSAKIAHVLLLGPFVEVGKVADQLDLIVAPQTLARALSAGLEADALRQRIESVAALPDTLSKTLAAASVVVGRAELVQIAGFLWVEDANVRDLLRTRRTTSELFLDPSPEGGLLVAPTVDVDKLVRRARTVGVEIVFEGQVVRAKTMPPPTVRMTPAGGTRMTPAAGTRMTPSGGTKVSNPLSRLTPTPGSISTTKIIRREED